MFNRWLAFGILVTTTALADLPPPDGQKFVSYAFQVQNAKSFPDWVLVAYPCSESDGAPMPGARVISDGQSVSVGRRGGTPALYRMKRTDYDANQATFKRSGPGEDSKPLEMLFASDKVVKCTGAAPTPSHLLAKSDPRTSIVQTLRADAVDATGCKIAAVADTTPASAPAPAPATQSSGAHSKSGCAGCAMPSEPGNPWILALSALVFLRIGRRRRHRRA
jgi:MYXO-CTERM domain-containing protein